ncbi:MAG: efflux RND transporter periplasmic adaptor subunit [Cytophagales bacterium]|nr:efflux RND transporter periplasmic adaptor subunit [Cytophagales bacterium]
MINNILNRFVLAALIAFTAACSEKKEETTTSSTPPPPVEPTRVIGTARVEPATKIVNISSEVNGIVKAVYFSSGSQVKKGDILLELTNDLEKAQWDEQKSAAMITKADANSILANIESAKIKASNFKDKFERLKKAFDNGAETKQNLDNAESDYKTALKEIDRLVASLQSNEAKQADETKKARIYEVQYQRRFIKAPANGTLLTFDIQPSMAVQQLSTLAEFAPDGDIIATCEIDELFASKVKVGQAAYIRTVGKTDTVALGNVIYASPNLKKKSLFSDTGTDLEDRRVREVRIKLEKNDKILLGMRVEGVITVK